MPLADQPMRVLEAALRDPAVVARYRAKVLEVPGSDCRWWQGAVSGRGHGRFYVGTVTSGSSGGDDSGGTGPPASPSSLVLAFPGALDDTGQPITAGSTTVLTKAAGRSLIPFLHPTGDTFQRTFAWGTAQPTTVTVIEPFVVEVEADASAENGVLRHAARLHRIRPDLDPGDAT